jgi:hypothetical protein
MMDRGGREGGRERERENLSVAKRGTGEYFLTHYAHVTLFNIDCIFMLK